MSPRLKAFLMFVLIVFIIVGTPFFLANVESAGINFLIRSLLVLFIIYLIMEIIGCFKA